jgi:hypothetical protein
MDTHGHMDPALAEFDWRSAPVVQTPKLQNMTSKAARLWRLIRHDSGLWSLRQEAKDLHCTAATAHLN